MFAKSAVTKHKLPFFSPLLRILLRRRLIRRCLQTMDWDNCSLQAIAEELGVSSPASIQRLCKQLQKAADALRKQGRMDSAHCAQLEALLHSSDPLALSEQLSPYHRPLEQESVYASSDAATRHALRRSLARFARYHRLPAESAVLLWKGEQKPLSPCFALLLLLPLPVTICLTLPIAALLSWKGKLLLSLAIPALFCAGYLLAAAALRKLLPTVSLPLLKSGTGHSLLTVGIGEIRQAEEALHLLARIAAGQSGGHYLLLLILPDHIVSKGAEEESQIATIRSKVDTLAEQLDLPISLLIAPRHYHARRKKWLGNPESNQLAELIVEYAAEASIDADAVCILPANAILLPGSSERLLAALFHPFCHADLLSFLSPQQTPLPGARLSTLRQCLLQKFGACADQTGFGIYRFSALRKWIDGEKLSSRLTAEPLYEAEGVKPSAYFPVLRQAPSLLPLLHWLLPILRPLLLFGMIAFRLPLLHCLLLWIVASTDLLASAFLSLRLNRRFYLYTIPAWKRLGKAFLLRTLLPTDGILEAADRHSRVVLHLSALGFGAIVIAVGTPLSWLGLFWCIAPFLLPGPPTPNTLTPDEKAACHALATELYPLLHRDPSSLPPAYYTEDGEAAPYTTPITIGTHLIAQLAACDLGIIDAFTLERTIGALLDRMEALPTRGGLPYAQYTPDTGEYYEDSHIDTAAGGIYALCLATAEAGLRELSSHQPGLAPLAHRIAHLSAQMDFTLLFNEKGILCRTLTPIGKQEGEISSLFDGGLSLFAALSSDSTLGFCSQDKSSAWQTLCSPALLNRGHCTIASDTGSLYEYLLTSFFLSSSRGSLIDYGREQALRTVIREARRANRSSWLKRVQHSLGKWRTLREKILFFKKGDDPLPADAPFQKRMVCCLLKWRNLSLPRLPHSLAGTSNALCLQEGYTPLPITAPVLCMMIPYKPHLALSHLKRLQEIDPHGGFADASASHQISQSGLALGLAALAGAVTRRYPSSRLMALPRCGALYPFLCRRPDAAVEGAPSYLSPRSEGEKPPLTPSVMLLGDAEHGLILAKGGGISLWEGGRPLVASTPANALFSGGRMSGMLLFRDGMPISMPLSIVQPHSETIPLCSDEVTCRLGQTTNGWSFSYEKAAPTTLDARFLICPAVQGVVHLSEESLTDADGSAWLCLCIEYSSSFTLTVAVRGLTNPFTHADPSPFPRGKDQIASLLRLSPISGNGWLSTPSCIIGGCFSNDRFDLQMICGQSKAATLALLRESASRSEIRTNVQSFPLPTSDGGLLSKVLEWQISALFQGDPIPCAKAVGGAGSDYAHLERCLVSGKETLRQRGFPCAEDAPIPLTVNRREGAEALLIRLLDATATNACTPLLPASGKTEWIDGYPRHHRGRDMPNLSRTYHNGIATLFADPEALHLRLPTEGDLLPIQLHLTVGERTQLLPAASTEVRYCPGEAIFSGEGFSLQISLLPRLPLLALRLTGAGSARLSFPSLPPPHKSSETEDLWYISEKRALFCRRLKENGESIFLVGCFPRAHDRLYYWMQEKINDSTLTDDWKTHRQALLRSASLLQIEEKHAPSLQNLAAAIMESDSPARALLAPLTEPAMATAHLVRLAMDEPTLLLPMALLICIAISDDHSIAHLRMVTKDGGASLYFLAARCLEKAMEEDGQNPLLPPLVEAFSHLAEEIGDHAGVAHYSAYLADQQTDHTAQWNSLPGISPKVVQLLAALLQAEAGAGDALLDAIETLPICPSLSDAALLWSGVLWGILGFTPGREGFTLAPLPLKKETVLRLSYKGEWKIKLSPDTPPICTRIDPLPAEHPKSVEKIFRTANISRQNRCISERNSVK